MHSTLALDHGGPNLAFEPFPRAALESSIIARFFAIADIHRDKLALHDEAQQWRYAELAERVQRLGRHLHAHLPPGTSPVALLFGHSVHFPLAMLSVLSTGRPYLPLDADFPAHRNARLLALAQPAALLCDEAHSAEARALAGANLPVITIDLPASGCDPEQCADMPEVKPESLAYLLYTSGTTGDPKGVYQNHRNLLHDVLQYSNAIHLRPDDRLTLLYSPSVNGAIRDIYGALLNGASLHLLSPRKLGWQTLLAELRKRAITVYHSVPPVFRAMTSAIGDGEPLNGIRLVYLAGDRLEWSDIQVFRRCFAATAHFYTGIGSTENATLYCHWFVPHDWPAQGVRVPLGRRIPERRIRLLDDEDREVATGEEGEIVTSSRYAALGYWHGHGGPEHFQADPEDPEARMVRTGDRARWRDDGLLELLGRRDSQVKLNGRRIELGEIESVLGDAPSLDELAVLVRPDAAGQPRTLVVWWAGQDHCEAAMRALAIERLPETMHPTAYCRVAALPRLPNFKLDRTTLAQLDAQAVANASQQEETANLSGTAAKVAALYSRALQRPTPPAPTETLHALGIDSLQWLTLELAIEQQFGHCPPREELLKDGSILGVAHWLDNHESKKNDVS